MSIRCLMTVQSLQRNPRPPVPAAVLMATVLSIPKRVRFPSETSESVMRYCQSVLMAVCNWAKFSCSWIGSLTEPDSTTRSRPSRALRSLWLRLILYSLPTTTKPKLVEPWDVWSTPRTCKRVSSSIPHPKVISNPWHPSRWTVISQGLCTPTLTAWSGFGPERPPALTHRSHGPAIWWSTTLSLRAMQWSMTRLWLTYHFCQSEYWSLSKTLLSGWRKWSALKTNSHLITQSHIKSVFIGIRDYCIGCLNMWFRPTKCIDVSIDIIVS